MMWPLCATIKYYQCHLTHMAEIRINNPEMYSSKNVDDSGRVYLGKEFAGKRTRIVVEEIEDDEEE